MQQIPDPAWTDLRKQVNSLQAKMDEIHRSRSWRLFCHCRNAVQVALPPGGLRRRLARAWWRFFLAPFQYLRPRKARACIESPDSGTSATVQPPPLTFVRWRTGTASVPTERRFRVAYIGRVPPFDAATLRYRAHNLIEALAFVGVEATFVAEEDLPTRIKAALSHDLIVLVRRQWNPTIQMLIEHARQAEIPVVYDLDDYLFDPWVLPYIDSARGAPAAIMQAIEAHRTTLEFCDYYTGTTPFLVERAADLNKPGWVIRNGLNTTQLHRCRDLLERAPERADGIVRIGYFSGTLTHQADFRVAYPALIRILREFQQVRLVVVGELELDLFPGLQPLAAQIDQWSFVDWRELPTLIASVDINIAPLEVNPFTQAKSNLKYYEAAILKVPTVASPTEALTASIHHGITGLLAASDEEWYQALRLLVIDPELRRRIGEKAHTEVLRDYVPSVVANEALCVYRQIIRQHRARRGLALDTLSMVLLISEPRSRSMKDKAVLRLAEKLTTAGCAVTVCVHGGNRFASAADLDAFLTAEFGAHHFAVQYGADIPCCDILLTTDSACAPAAAAYHHRAYRVLFLEQNGSSIANLVEGPAEALVLRLRQAVCEAETPQASGQRFAA